MLCEKTGFSPYTRANLEVKIPIKTKYNAVDINILLPCCGVTCKNQFNKIFNSVLIPDHQG